MLVADSMTGQDAVNTAKNFDERVGLSGIILTRVDGDARGGAALSMRQSPASQSSLSALAKKMDALEVFHLIASPDVSSIWATCCRWWKKLFRTSIRMKLPRWPRKCKRPVRHDRLSGPDGTNAENGRRRRINGHAARHGQSQRSSLEGKTLKTRFSRNIAP